MSTRKEALKFTYKGNTTSAKKNSDIPIFLKVRAKNISWSIFKYSNQCMSETRFLTFDRNFWFLSTLKASNELIEFD